MKRFLITTLLCLASGAWAAPIDEAIAADKRGDSATAVRLLKPLAAKGDAVAQHLLGELHTFGIGVIQDYEVAMKWYRLAAEKGNANAQFAIGLNYEIGRGVDRDPKEAVKWYRIAAKQGHSGAQLYLGYWAFGSPTALNWFRLAAEQGHALAQSELGNIYELGLIASQDYVRAHMWFNLAAARGLESAVSRRNSLEQKMTLAKIEEAKNLARSCQLRYFKECD